ALRRGPARARSVEALREPRHGLLGPADAPRRRVGDHARRARAGLRLAARRVGAHVLVVRRTLLALLVAALPLTALAQGSRPECIRVEAIVRWGADAYNHFVRVENGCDRRARCRVST